MVAADVPRSNPHPGPTLADLLGRYPRSRGLILAVARALGRAISTTLTRALWPAGIHGAPPDLPRVALIANHASHLDSLAVLSALPRRHRGRLAVLAARDTFFERPLTAILAGILGGGVAFDRRDRGELRRWARILETAPDDWFLVYPTGSRRSAELHAGIVGILARAGWTLVPVAIGGTVAAWPPDARLPRPLHRLSVAFGDPVDGADVTAALERIESFWKEHTR
jgi:1-acyl-sn-glycerol-3-phosphate acyltransferase